MKRSPRNPILTRADIPDLSPHVSEVSSVFNPGAFRLRDGYRLVLRVRTRGRETAIMLADSEDGAAFEVQPRLLKVEGLDKLGFTVFHALPAESTRPPGAAASWLERLGIDREFTRGDRWVACVSVAWPLLAYLDPGLQRRRAAGDALVHGWRTVRPALPVSPPQKLRARPRG